MKKNIKKTNRLVHLKNRKTNLIDRYFNHRLAAHMHKRAQKYASANGYRKMAIFAHDWIGISINQYGIYGKEELELLFELLHPLSDTFKEGVAIDIGAHVGNHSLYFANYFSHVFSYEPNPKVFELLSFNTLEKKNISINNYGLGDARGSLKFYVENAEIGSSSFIEQYHGLENQTIINVAIERLDDSIIKFHDLCFIKIDVEGYEEKALKGATNTIKQYMPLIVIEQHQREFLNGTTPAIEFLTEIGYSFCWQENGFEAKNWVVRRIINLWELFFGVTFSIVSEAKVPPNTYSMLIAVPPRFSNILSTKN